MIDPVVDVEWVAAHGEGLVLADVRWSLAGGPGRADYEDGHVPGAVFVDLDAQLAAPASAAHGRHPLPDPVDFAGSMSALGVGDDSVVVAYDDSGGSSAARLVWMLRVLGHDAALLDGGLAAWTAAHGADALERGATVPEAAAFRTQPWPAARIVTASEIEGLVRDGVPVLDARDHGRFTGERPAPVDARPGHVPGARNAPWQDNLDADGRFHAPEQLRRHYAERGVDEAAEPVLYCGSGVTACHDLLALERAGLTGARLYPGSWSQWAPDERRPVETGD